MLIYYLIKSVLRANYSTLISQFNIYTTIFPDSPTGNAIARFYLSLEAIDEFLCEPLDRLQGSSTEHQYTSTFGCIARNLITRRERSE